MNGIDVVAIVQNIGFPIFVAAYLLIRLERTLSGLKDTLSGLRNTLVLLNQPWNGVERCRPVGAEGTRAPWRERGA